MAQARVGTGIALSLICLCILAVMPILANSRPEAFDALGFAFWLSAWQTLFGAPLFWRDQAARRRRRLSDGSAQRRPPALKNALAVALGAGALFGLATYLYVLGVERAGAVNAAIALQAYPLFAILIETLFLNRRKTPLELALTAALIGALVTLATGGTFRVEALSVWFFVALSVPLLWSVAHVIVKETMNRTDVTPTEITFARAAVSTACLGVVAAAASPESVLDALSRADFQVFALAMGLIYYVDLVLWFHAVRHIDVSLASSIITPWPAATMALAASVLGEAVARHQIAAFAVAALSVYGLMWISVRKARTSSA